MGKHRGTAVVRGGGDLATGVIYRLWRAGFKIICLETEFPLVVRRTVAAAQAVFDGTYAIDGMKVVRIASLDDMDISGDRVEILIDPDGKCIRDVKPDILVDAIMAKKNIGTRKDMAPLVVGIGPGFTAQEDVHAVIETKRGHYLGRMITEGSAIPNTGIPGMEMGYTIERLLRAPACGMVEPIHNIGDRVEKGEAVAKIGEVLIHAQIKGVLRGLIHPSVHVEEGMKIGDVDPRNEPDYCWSITDKALALGGGVLEALFVFKTV